MNYYITKSSRLSDKPYEGPTCYKAGVIPGKYYDTKEEAEKDALLLTRHNEVGFIVKKVEEE